MKRIINGFYIIVFITLLQGPVFSQGGLIFDDFEKVGQAGFKFLSIGVGTRNTAMGGAGATNEGDAVSLFWNPAGVASMKTITTYVGHTQWFADISQTSLSAVLPVANVGNFGLSFTYMDYGNIERTAIPSGGASSWEDGIAYVDLGIIKPSALTVGLSYSKALTDRFEIGGTLKYAYENLVVMNKGTFAIDFGTIYNAGVHDLKIAVVMQHFGFEELNYINQGFILPLTFRVGFSGDILSLSGLASGTNKIILAVEAVKPIDYSERIHLGMEYLYNDMIALRAGYRFNYDSENITLGFSVKYMGFDIGYSFANFTNNFGSVNRFDLQYYF
ncbi:MAG: PorV/PorQ family protein [Flavobacteriaceae bacterium]|nr:PorV/PorQ family protein [Flavobacteriaceae bacterium]